jgi:hypothetical protein
MRAGFNVTTVAPASIIPGASDCPNPNWTEEITDLSFTSATITVEQPPGTVVLTVTCSFSTRTANGCGARQQRELRSELVALLRRISGADRQRSAPFGPLTPTASAFVEQDGADSCREGLDLLESVRRVPPPLGGWIMGEADAGPPGVFRSDRSRDEPAAAVGTDVSQDPIDTVGAERAFVAADPRLGGLRRQIPVTELAVGSKVEHA